MKDLTILFFFDKQGSHQVILQTKYQMKAEKKTNKDGFGEGDGSRRHHKHNQED
jgi:hypothetical protein